MDEEYSLTNSAVLKDKFPYTCACTLTAQSEYKAIDTKFLDSLTPTTSTASTLATCHTLPTSTPDGDSEDQSRGCPRSKKHHCNCHGQSYDSDMIGEEYV